MKSLTLLVLLLVVLLLQEALSGPIVDAVVEEKVEEKVEIEENDDYDYVFEDDGALSVEEAEENRRKEAEKEAALRRKWGDRYDALKAFALTKRYHFML